MPEYHYISLLRLKLTHEFYGLSSFEGLQVIAPFATRQKMQDLGLLYRPTDNGCHIIAEAINKAGTLEAARPIEEEQRLQLFLAITNPAFLSITEGDPVQAGRQIFYFNSSAATSTGAGEEILNGPLLGAVGLKSRNFSYVRKDSNAVRIQITNPLGDSSTQLFKFNNGSLSINFNSGLPGLYQLQELDNGNNPLGSAEEIYFHPEATSANALIAFEVVLNPPVDLTTPTNYLFNFEAREVLWRYQIFKHALPNSLGTDPYTGLAVLHTPQGSDPLIPFAAASGSNPVTIQSTGPVKLREQAYRQVNLENSGDTVLENLSNPDARHLKEDSGQWVSDIKLNLYI